MRWNYSHPHFTLCQGLKYTSFPKVTLLGSNRARTWTWSPSSSQHTHQLTESFSESHSPSGQLASSGCTPEPSTPVGSQQKKNPRNSWLFYQTETAIWKSAPGKASKDPFLSHKLLFIKVLLDGISSPPGTWNSSTLKVHQRWLTLPTCNLGLSSLAG